jgi:hypothetical protein
MEIPLQDNRQKLAQRVQLLQDTAGIVLLFPAALHRLQNPGALTIALGLVELLAIVFAVGSAVFELKGKTHGSNRVDLSNLYLAVVLLLEYGFGVAAGRKRFSPLLLTALTAFFLAFFRSDLQRKFARRGLQVDENGLNARLSKFRRFNIRWSDLSSIDDTRDLLRLRLRDGRVYQLPLGRYANREEIRAAVVSYAGRYALT